MHSFPGMILFYLAPPFLHLKVFCIRQQYLVSVFPTFSLHTCLCNTLVDTGGPIHFRNWTVTLVLWGTYWSKLSTRKGKRISLHQNCYYYGVSCGAKSEITSATTSSTLSSKAIRKFYQQVFNKNIAKPYMQSTLLKGILNPFTAKDAIWHPGVTV